MFSHRLSRRRLLHTGSVATGALAGLAAIPPNLTAVFRVRPEPIPTIQDPRIKELVQRALNAARDAGASYADVRLTYTRDRSYVAFHWNPTETEKLHVGVRALVQGYWGFASSPVWNATEMARLGAYAAYQAKTNMSGRTRAISLPPVTPIVDKHWSTPVRIDPFAIHPDEISDYLFGLKEKLENMLGRLDPLGNKHRPAVVLSFKTRVQEKAFGSTDGTYFTQRLIRSEGKAQAKNDNVNGDDMDLLTPAGVGWELFVDNAIIERVRESIELNKEIARLPVKPMEVGRYATVLDAFSVASLLSTTIGPATEIDRILTYEANATGTSYIIDPDEAFRTFRLGNKLTVTGNRDEPGGLATVPWDDEGVETKPFSLFTQGTLTGFHTSREGTGWLESTYARNQEPYLSHGCVNAETAGDIPYIRVANLVMQPDATTQSIHDLEAGIGKGMSIAKLKPSMDFQLTNGYAAGFECFEILGGKRVARVANGGILFKTSEIWKNMTAIGDKSSVWRFGMEDRKGQPEQTSYHSVTAAPVAVKELTYIIPGHR